MWLVFLPMPTGERTVGRGGRTHCPTPPPPPPPCRPLLPPHALPPLPFPSHLLPLPAHYHPPLYRDPTRATPSAYTRVPDGCRTRTYGWRGLRGGNTPRYSGALQLPRLPSTLWADTPSSFFAPFSLYSTGIVFAYGCDIRQHCLPPPSYPLPPLPPSTHTSPSPLHSCPLVAFPCPHHYPLCHVWHFRMGRLIR